MKIKNVTRVLDPNKELSIQEQIRQELELKEIGRERTLEEELFGTEEINDNTISEA